MKSLLNEYRYGRQKKRYKFIFKYILVPFFALFGLFSLIFIILKMVMSIAILEALLSLQPNSHLNGINILALGIDDTRFVKRSDTIMVFHLDPAKQRIGVLSIPRDTRTKVPGYGMTKINHAYAHGGVELVKKAVTGFLNIPIHYYIRVNVSGLADLVDKLNGVRVTVHNDLYYEDKAGGLKIDLKKGDQVLNGNQALQYLRFRGDKQGDIGRIARQQSFLKAIVGQVVKAGNIMELPGLIKQLNRNIKTDLSITQMVSLTSQFSKAIKEGRIDKETVPGAIALIDGVSYWKPNISNLDSLVENVLLGFDKGFIEVSEERVVTVDEDSSKENRRKLSLNEVSRVTEILDFSDEDHGIIIPKGIKLEILNGYGGSSGAQDAAKVFKDFGIQVARFDNAGTYGYDETLVVDWKGSSDQALALSFLIGVDPSHIIVYDRPEKPLDFTIVLGSDWPSLLKKINNKQNENTY